jgi:hypothetical protein
MMNRDDWRAVVYTPERKLWLDPEDADELVADILEAIRKDADLRVAAYRAEHARLFEKGCFGS